MHRTGRFLVTTGWSLCLSVAGSVPAAATLLMLTSPWKTRGNALTRVRTCAQRAPPAQAQAAEDACATVTTSRRGPCLPWPRVMSSPLALKMSERKGNCSFGKLQKFSLSNYFPCRLLISVDER